MAILMVCRQRKTNNERPVSYQANALNGDGDVRVADASSWPGIKN